jgi:hypothetical protein
LYRSWASSKYLISRPTSIAVQIDKYVNLVLDDLVDKALGGPIVRIVENRCFSFDLLSMNRTVTGCSGVAEGLDASGVV